MFHVKQYKILAIICSILCCLFILISFIPFSSFAVTDTLIKPVAEGYYYNSSADNIFGYSSSFQYDTPDGHVSYVLSSSSSYDEYTFSFNSITYDADTESVYFNYEGVNTTQIYYGQSVEEIKISFSSSFSAESLYHWLGSSFTFVSTSDPPLEDLTPLLAGYYQFLPITQSTFDPSFIGVGNTISFTNMSDMYAVFTYGDRLEISKLSFSLHVNNALVLLDTYIESPQWVEPILIASTSMVQGDSNGTTSLPPDTSFNPPLGSFLYFDVDNDLFEVDEDTWILLDDLLSYSSTAPSTSERPVIPEPPPSEWTENPFVTILSLIIEALQVPLFGYFSPWDIFITILGIFITIWLLKFIAGG